MAWYQVKGNMDDVVISSRIRLARNLCGFAFDEKLTVEKAKEVINKIDAALSPLDFLRTDMEKLGETEAAALVEQHLVSREFAAKKTPHALFRNDNKSLYVMACEEDHIRLQCILPGLCLGDAYRFTASVNEALDTALTIAFDEKLGYITHCPTNLGTGMRASVMLFLPALAGGGYIPSLARQLTKIGLTIRGLYGEGSDSHGAIFQISNQVTLGISEEEILRKLEDTVTDIIEKEQTLRNAPNGEAAERREDRIHRAEGILRYATRISSAEFFSLWADMKLGVSLGMIQNISHETLNTLLIHVMPAMLTAETANPPKTGSERDALRAKFIKKALEVKKE